MKEKFEDKSSKSSIKKRKLLRAVGEGMKKERVEFETYFSYQNRSVPFVDRTAVEFGCNKGLVIKGQSIS